MSAIQTLFDQREVIVLTGTGGVGKTTTSAALAISAARAGKNVVVITIDPAKRLKTSLGIEELSDHPTDLTQALKELIPDFKGRLAAVVPDTEKTFRDFVHSLTESDSLRQRVFKNPIYQMLAQEHSGANEYMALKRLERLHTEGHYDLIVLDTPPSRNTLAFLNAPQLLTRFFDEKYIQWLASPAQRFLSFGVNRVLKVLEGLTGKGFLTDLMDFARALFEVRTPFLENLNRVTELLKSQKTGFIMVTQPSPEVLDEVSHLKQTFGSQGFLFDGLILNRSFSAFDRRDEGRDGPAEPTPPEVTGAVDAARLMEGLIERERSAEDQIRKLLAGQKVLEARVPEFARDIHSLRDLVAVASRIEESSEVGA